MVDAADPLPLRLAPGADLREAIEAALVANGATAAYVVAGIGSLEGARIRFAAERSPRVLNGPLEILTLAGSVARDGAHLHISVADAQGRVVGGHVARGCRVRTTAEVVLLVLSGWTFAREHDPATGYDELVVAKR